MIGVIAKDFLCPVGFSCLKPSQGVIVGIHFVFIFFFVLGFAGITIGSLTIVIVSELGEWYGGRSWKLKGRFLLH